MMGHVLTIHPDVAVSIQPLRADAEGVLHPHGLALPFRADLEWPVTRDELHLTFRGHGHRCVFAPSLRFVQVEVSRADRPLTFLGCVHRVEVKGDRVSVLFRSLDSYQQYECHGW